MKHATADLATLRRLPRNVKAHDLGAIHTSIATFGFLEPIVVNETTGRILSGHGRLDTLQQLKSKGAPPPVNIEAQGKAWQVPVVYVQVEEAREDAAAIALNRAGELGGWDDEALASVLADIAATSEELLAATGFDGEALDELLRSLAPPDVDFKEYGENAADDVEFHECPSCGHRWPK